MVIALQVWGEEITLLYEVFYLMLTNKFSSESGHKVSTVVRGLDPYLL